MRLSLRSCDGKGGDADLQVGDDAQGMIAVFGGGSGGDNVIDQKDVFVLEAFGMAHGKDFFHVVHACLSVFVGLGVGVAAAVEVVGHDGQVHDLGHGFAEQFALVVTAVAFATAMQRHGDKTVYIAETSGRL